MPRNIHIKKQNIQEGASYMDVRPSGLSIDEGVGLKFHNSLQDRPTANITFYPIEEKGSSAAAISGFCSEESGSVFTVPAPHRTCTPTVTGDYAYTITAAGYQDLDPVIIIEPTYHLMSWFNVVVILGAALAAGIGYLVGFGRGKKSAQAHRGGSAGG